MNEQIEKVLNDWGNENSLTDCIENRLNSEWMNWCVNKYTEQEAAVKDSEATDAATEKEDGRV